MKVKNLDKLNNYLKKNGFLKYTAIKIEGKDGIKDTFIDLKTGKKTTNIKDENIIVFNYYIDVFNEGYCTTSCISKDIIKETENGVSKFYKTFPHFITKDNQLIFKERTHICISYDEKFGFTIIKDISKKELIESIKELNLKNLDKIIWYIENVIKDINDYTINCIIKNINNNKDTFVYDKSWINYENIMFFENITKISVSDFLIKYKVSKEDLNVINDLLSNTLPTYIKKQAKKYFHFIKLVKKIDENYLYYLSRNNLTISIYYFVNNVLDLYSINKKYSYNLLLLVKNDYNFKIFTIEAKSEDAHILKYKYTQGLKELIDIKFFADLFLDDLEKYSENFQLAINLAPYSPMLAIEIMGRKELTDDERKTIKETINKPNYKKILNTFYKDNNAYSLKKLVKTLDDNVFFNSSISNIQEATQDLINCGYDTNYVEVLDLLIKNVFFEEQDNSGGKRYVPLRRLGGNGRLQSLNILISEFISKYKDDNSLTLTEYLKCKDSKFLFKAQEKIFRSKIEKALNNNDYRNLVKDYDTIDVDLETFYNFLYKNTEIQAISLGKNFAAYLPYNEMENYDSNENNTYLLPEAKGAYLTKDNKIVIVHKNNNIYIY